MRVISNDEMMVHAYRMKKQRIYYAIYNTLYKRFNTDFRKLDKDTLTAYERGRIDLFYRLGKEYPDLNLVHSEPYSWYERRKHIMAVNKTKAVRLAKERLENNYSIL
jgi:hypothetical protein